METKKKVKIADTSKPLLGVDVTPGMIKKADEGGIELPPLINSNDMANIISRGLSTPTIPQERKKTLEPQPGPELEKKEKERVAKPKKMIEFDKHLTDLKTRTESEVPYCMT
jgi:hypothetical protein